LTTMRMVHTWSPNASSYFWTVTREEMPRRSSYHGKTASIRPLPSPIAPIPARTISMDLFAIVEPSHLSK